MLRRRFDITKQLSKCDHTADNQHQRQREPNPKKNTQIQQSFWFSRLLRGANGMQFCIPIALAGISAIVSLVINMSIRVAINAITGFMIHIFRYAI